MLRLALWRKLQASNFVAHCEKHSDNKDHSWPSTTIKELPTRDQALRALKTQKEYDLLIIGGGATGSGENFHYVFLKTH